MARPRNYPGPWYGDLRKRISFEGAVRARFPHIQGRRSRRPGSRGWMYTVTIPVQHYGPRSLRILFSMPFPELPLAFVDGPRSPHRFEDGALCMWAPRASRSERWVFDDGLELLLGHVMVHLFKEAWWQEYGEWLGDETPHGDLGLARRINRRQAA